MPHPPATSRRPLPIPLLAMAFCVLWSSAFVAGKQALADAPPLTVLCVRFLLAGLLLGGWAWARGQLRGLGRGALARLALLGVVNSALYLGLSYEGMRHVSAGLTSIVIACTPVLVAVGATMLGREGLNGRKLLGLGLGVAGVGLVVRGRIGAGADDPLFLLFTLGALLALTAGTLLYKALAPRVALQAGTAVQALAAGVALIPLVLTVEAAESVRLTPSLLLSMAWLIGPALIGAHLAWYGLLERTSAGQASAWHFTTPPMGLLLSWLVLAEAVAPLDLLGILPVALAIALVTRPGKGQNRPLPQPAGSRP